MPQMALVGTQKSDEYIYSPLDISKADSVRLLQVLRSENGQICCSLTHTCLSEAKYYALSYAWGPPGDERTIIVNGLEMYIRRNLFEFLHRMTHFPFLNFSTGEKDGSHWADSRKILLWIDAICLDQSNTSERNHQVQQMYRIYNQAEAVLAWLGCGDNELEEWFRKLSVYGRHNAQDKISIQYAVTTLNRLVTEKFLSLDYWLRLWVTQEIGLASELFILYGYNLASWKIFWKELADYNGQSNLPAHFHRHVRLRQKESRSLVDFAGLLESASQLLCTDPRDHIYGLLALDPDGPQFQVDYDESVLELAARVSTFFIRKGTFLLGSVLRSLSAEAHMLQHAQSIAIHHSREGTAHAYCSNCGYEYPIPMDALTTCLVVCGRILRSNGHMFYHGGEGGNGSWFGPLSGEAEYRKAVTQAAVARCTPQLSPPSSDSIPEEFVLPLTISARLPEAKSIVVAMRRFRNKRSVSLRKDPDSPGEKVLKTRGTIFAERPSLIQQKANGEDIRISEVHDASDTRRPVLVPSTESTVPFHRASTNGLESLHCPLRQEGRSWRRNFPAVDPLETTD